MKVVEEVNMEVEDLVKFCLIEYYNKIINVDNMETKCERCGIEDNGIEFSDKYGANLCESCKSEIKRENIKPREEVDKYIIMGKAWILKAQNAWNKGDKESADKYLSKALVDLKKAKENIPV